ncbi:uncharacterized protein N0V89_007961 [Didymosphaeria variabile]|uniref:Nephrocystin 3-like N-terminal domain-containing protein n=1 Tax=Didymosphaeria variabile TaxID=1932322 RepID=A0A9W8XFW0_9PLEO|nr:uncharacterized protein N0V89_007961 [Didymosphaeria variabile]KAJ4349347.1 hypothetical protein N0V89_007961 [Didymosphaeria variabile]
MDPVTAVGLVANILQFVELGCKIFTNAKEIRHSASGLTQNDQRTMDVISEMHRLSLNLETPGREPSDANEKALFKLACECRKLSHEILKLLDKTSTKNPGSKSEAIRSTVRRMRSNIKDRLISLAIDNETQLSTINDLNANLKHLHDRLSSSSSSNDDLMQKVRELVQLPQAAREAVAQQQILRMLDNDDFNLRYDIVDKAHRETFRWIVEEGNNAESERLSDSRKLLRTWLAEEQGGFHIAGKLGSGKSTLMKFLFSHPKTVSDLQEWSGTREFKSSFRSMVSLHYLGTRRLAFVNFFFWRPGSTWQNSVRGLLQHLVYGTLRSCPELIQVAFPVLWEETVQSFRHPFEPYHYDRRSIGDETIQTALGNILTHAKVHKTHRLCFFIDALDEQNDPSPQNDHKALVEMIQSWSESSDGALKVCVSSREDNVFMNAFNPNRRLRLQDLTRQDLEEYVDQKLPDIPSTDTRQRISATIVERSCGIFLWVVLVVKALREAFEDGRELSDFEAELNCLPSELEALFAYLLRTIPVSRRRNAYCFLRLMPYPTTIRIPLHGVLYLEKYLKNPRFALEEGPSKPRFGQDPHSRVSPREEAELVKARKTLQGDCRGLVESQEYEGKHHVVFTHRSVPEFLEKPATKELMGSETSDFIVGEALAQMLLGQLRAADESRADIDPQYKTLTLGYIFDVLYIYHDKKRRQHDPTNEYLTVLENELQRKRVAILGPYTYSLPGFGDILKSLFRNDDRDEQEATRIFHPCYALAIFGDLDYVEWKLEQDPLLMVHAGNRSLLLVFMISGLTSRDCNWWGPQVVRIAQQLLAMGSLESPHCILAMLIMWLTLWQSDDHQKFMGSKPFFGPLFAALLGKVEEENHFANNFSVERMVMDKSTVLEVYWNEESLTYEQYGNDCRRGRGIELAQALGNDRFKLRDVIELLNFENGDEILALIDRIEAPAGSSGGLDQTADTSRTSTSHTQMRNLSVGLSAEPLEKDASVEREKPKEEAADDCEATPVQALRWHLRSSLSGLRTVYFLFALVGRLSTLLSPSRPLIYRPGILCAFLVYRVLSG